MTDQPPAGTGRTASHAGGWERWVRGGVAAAGLVVVLWAGATAGDAILHGHPLYAVLLGLTLLGSSLGLWRARRTRQSTRRQRLGTAVLLVTALVWIALMAWLRPFQAVEPALAALRGDARVSVVESATRIVLTPTAPPRVTGVFFLPGARVDARAYAAVLRPLAEAGHVVVIDQPPLGIAFLSLTAHGSVKADHPERTRWVVGGHSLGGTVATLQADEGDADPAAPVVGLVLHGSYPAGDVTSTLRAAVLSVSGTRDGLATPDKIAASRVDLPASTVFTPVEGAVHAYFGDYGPQPGDGTPTIDHDEARAQISAATATFVERVGA